MDSGNSTTDNTQPPTLDNTPSACAKEAVELRKSLGIMTGDGTGNLLLYSPITRE